MPGAPPASPLICYEIIFPDEITERGERPGWLLNVTNDAWFGTSAGPYQHFHQAQVRAIEQGLPVARAANTGISAVIDPYGRILAEIGLGEKGVLDADLPKVGPTTPFVQFGIVLEITVLLLAFCRLVRLPRATCWTAPLTQQEQKCRAAPACLTEVNRTPMNDREMGAIISSSCLGEFIFRTT